MWPAGVPPGPLLAPRATQHLVQPSAIQHGCQLVEAGLRGVQQELDFEQIFLKQKETKMQMDRD